MGKCKTGGCSQSCIDGLCFASATFVLILHTITMPALVLQHKSWPRSCTAGLGFGFAHPVLILVLHQKVQYWSAKPRSIVLITTCRYAETKINPFNLKNCKKLISLIQLRTEKSTMREVVRCGLERSSLHGLVTQENVLQLAGNKSAGEPRMRNGHCVAPAVASVHWSLKGLRHGRH